MKLHHTKVRGKTEKIIKILDFSQFLFISVIYAFRKYSYMQFAADFIFWKTFYSFSSLKCTVKNYFEKLE